MATNIEQIFRSFVVSKFREIQEQQFGGGKVGSQLNGDINSSEQLSPSADTVKSIGNLQNDPLVQKIEQVLSEVLGAESQYKPDGGDNTVKNKSCSNKRGLSDEVQDEISRKRSKKDKKHKDKKKKKKRKKEKKYKKQSKESKLNAQHKGHGDIDPAAHSKPESLRSALSTENVNVGSTTPLKQASEWSIEKTVYENLTSALSDSHNVFCSDTSKLDISEEESALIRIQELSEVELTTETDVENDLAVNLNTEAESLNIVDAEDGAVCVRSTEAGIIEMKQPEANSVLEVTERISVPDSNLKFVRAELEGLETSLESEIVDVKTLDSSPQSLHTERVNQLAVISSEKPGDTFMKNSSEAIIEAQDSVQDSVTTLGFLAMVVGKDFEATSDFLNTAKVKASERSPKHDMKDDSVDNSERIVMMTDLEKPLRSELRSEMKDFEETTESLLEVTEKEFEPNEVPKPKSPLKDSKQITDTDAHKCPEVNIEAKAIAELRVLKEDRTSAVMMELKESVKHPAFLPILADMKDFRREPELEVMNRANTGVSLPDAIVEEKHLEATLEFDNVGTKCLKTKNVCTTDKENWKTVPEPLRVVGVKNLDRPKFEEAEQVNYLETSFKTIEEKGRDSVITQDPKAVVEMKCSETITESEAVKKINDPETIPQILDIVKTRCLESSKGVDVTDTENESIVNLKDLKEVPESVMTVKILESVAESQYMKEMQNVKGPLKSAAVEQRTEANQEPESDSEERELDATSESLQMIFTNYSEHSLELYTEPEVLVELKNSEPFPELVHIGDANKSEALHTREFEGFKTVGSETMVGLNDLGKKIDSLPSDVKHLEVISESQTIPTEKYSETSVASETVAQEEKYKTLSHSVTRLEEKACDSVDTTSEKNQNDPKTTGLEIPPGCWKMTEGIGENEPSAKIEGPFFLSNSLQEISVMYSETASEVEATSMIHELKETVGFTEVMETGLDGPKETLDLDALVSVDSKDASRAVKTAKDSEFIPESLEECHLKSLQLQKAEVREMNLDSLYNLELQCSERNLELLFSDKLSNLEEKQELKDRTQTTGLMVPPKSLFESERDLIIVPESEDINEVGGSEYSLASMNIAEINSENILKPLYMIQGKDPKTISESKIMDIKDFSSDSESTLRASIEVAKNSPDCDTIILSEVLETISETPAKNEMSQQSQSISILQQSDAPLRSEALTFGDVKKHSEMCVIDTEHLEVTAECEELKVEKQSEVAPASVFALDMIGIETTSPFHTNDDKELKEDKISETAVEVQQLTVSAECIDSLDRTFGPIYITDVKDLEVSQRLETCLESLDKKEVNNKYTEPAYEEDAQGSETIEICQPIIDTSISDGTFVAADTEEKDSGLYPKPDSDLVANYSESLSESVTISETEDGDTTLTVYMVDVKSSEASSDFLNTEEMIDSKTTLQLEATLEPLCMLESRHSNDPVESVPIIVTKGIEEALNYETVLQIEDSVAIATHVDTPELKAPESLRMLEVTDSERILELNTSPTPLGAADLKSSIAVVETETLEIIDSDNLKPETTLEVKYFESTSETEYVLETYSYKTPPETESTMEEKLAETTSELVCIVEVEDLVTIPEPKHVHEKDLYSPTQSGSNLEARDLEASVIYEDVLNVSQTTPQLSSTMEIKDLGVASSMVEEAVKVSRQNLELQLCFKENSSEAVLECTHKPVLKDTYADLEPVCIVEEQYSEPTAEMACMVDVKNSEANSESVDMLLMKDAEIFLKSKTALPSDHSEDFAAALQCESLGERNDLQSTQAFIDEEERMHSEELVKALEREEFESNSISMVSEEKVSEISLKSVYSEKAKHSEASLDYISAKGVEVPEQISEDTSVAEDLDSTPEQAVLVQTNNLERSPQVTMTVKDPESSLIPLCIAKERGLEITPEVSLEEIPQVSSEDQSLEAVLQPVCIAADMEANKQTTAVKVSEAGLESVRVPEEDDLEPPPQASLKDQDLEAVPKSSDSTKENEGTILKDKKSEKISSKSKDKGKSGKKAKKSRSKSPSKSKKHKKKSRSRSTSRQAASRRARSRSKNESDSRKKHSFSRRKSRSKSVGKKDKESSKSRRRRSRTSDHYKSRSRSVDKRDTSVRSRHRRSRSSARKSRSRSVDNRESARARRRLSRSSDNRKSRSRSIDKRETLIRSRRRRSRSSDHRKSRSRSVDKRETSVRTRRRRSRSSDIRKSRSRSIDKRDTSVRRRRRWSRSSDNCKSRSKSVDRRDSSIRSRRRRSISSNHRKSRSRSIDDKKETPVRTKRRRSRSSDNRRSRSRSLGKRETSVRTRRRQSRSFNNRKSRSRSFDKEASVRTRRRRSRSSDNHKSKSRSVDKEETSVRTRRRQSRSSDNRRSRTKSVDRRGLSGRRRRRRSRSSDNHKSRSRSVDKGETSGRAKRRHSRSSDNRKSRSKSVDKIETSTRSKRRRSRSSDNRKSRSKSVDKIEISTRSKRRRSKSLDNRKSRSKSVDKMETSARSRRRRSRSSENRKSRSKSVNKVEASVRSKRQRSKSSDKSRTKSAENRETSVKSKHRRSKSSDRHMSKSKSRSKSSERRKDKDSSDELRGKRSKSRSKSKSLEKTEGPLSLEASVHDCTKSHEHPKSKSRSKSKSLEKAAEKESLRRSRSKTSEPKSHSNRTASRSRRNRSRSLTRKRTSRSKSDNRSRTRSQTRSRSCSRRWRRSRSRSVSRQRSLSRERRRRSRRNRSRSAERRRRRSDSRDSYRISLRLRSRSRTPVRLRCSRSTGRRRSASASPDHRRSRSSSRSPKRLTDLDKAQLLEIAKANAAAMCAKAGVPLPPSLMPVIVPEKKEEKVTQKSAKETIMELTEKCKKIAQSQEDDVIVNKPHVSDEEEEEHPFINHPFKLNEPKPIFFNLTSPSIKPAPPKNQVTLTKEFPVSSGSQHRKKEADSAYGEWVPVEKSQEEAKDDVFPNPATLEPVDISSALNERTIAQKRLTENTFDLEAMCLLNRAQERIDAWAQLNSLPGQFTGSTGAQVLSSEQLSNSGPQAWIKKDQFLRAAPVSGGMGAQLMRKMGWREGEGLGKNREGSKEPILVDFKTDRKGLVAVGEKTQKRHGPFGTVKDLAGKHPVSALMEACNKRRWSPPVFVLLNDNGPDHQKHFLFKVLVNGIDHKPTYGSPNKKHAKATAATVALQALGLAPKELLANTTTFRSASQT